ncbi:LysR substrate-binding domain-containing protein [Pseudomonas sp. NPDC096925]|uniref:LysR substrate-binding domain-containing protein n=1 Tax=Pseudomonas sp. NPDC096925 TaxID=3364484 RepID=UPI00383B83B9
MEERYECVHFRYQSSRQALRWPYEEVERTLEVTPQAGVTIDISDAVPAVLAVGGGIGISPCYVAARYVKRGELLPVLPRFTLERFPITALWRKAGATAPNVKAFIQFLGELFPSPTPWDQVVD